MLVSYAIGALLGASFLEVLPHAITASGDASTTTATVLGGILAFFIMEKLVLWRHCHVEECEGHEPLVHAHGHEHDYGRSGMMILVGDTFHNTVDGVLIAAAFMEDVRLGIVTGAGDDRARDSAGGGRLCDPAAFRLFQGARAGLSTCSPAWRHWWGPCWPMPHWDRRKAPCRCCSRWRRRA